MNTRIRKFLDTEQPGTPCLVVDLEVITERYRALAEAFPTAAIYYAVKANPAPQVISALAALGAHFDTASVPEITLCMEQGVPAGRIAFGHPVKKQRDIAAAYDRGVRLFAFDSAEELNKLVEAAPGARVYCRILTSSEGADWPMSHKFGCTPEVAGELLVRARALGLVPTGVSFHVGSQQRDPARWDTPIGDAARIAARLEQDGHALAMVNLGGGLPAHYRRAAPALNDYAQAITRSLTRHFGNRLPNIVLEPGRYIAADAGVIQAEVVLISRRPVDAETRWVYLDVGKFGGLAETMDEAIEYRIRTPRDGGPAGPVVLAGPTCDEMDVLYDKAGYALPWDLQIGDKIEILSAGAYSASYSSVGFNGFPPLKEYYI